MQRITKRVRPVAWVLLSVVLLGSGVWANLSQRPLQEMRGAWLTQSMRGMVY